MFRACAKSECISTTKPANVTSHVTLTVRLLVARAGRGAAKLLGLAAAGVSDEQRAVVRVQDALDFLLGRLVHVLHTHTAGNVSGSPLSPVAGRE